MTNFHISEQFALTDTGKQRRANEDSILVKPPLFAVADGMGGAQAGEVASSMATDTLSSQAKTLNRGETTLSEVIGQANGLINAAAEKPELKGMGTTVTAALLENQKLSIAHVGDSRAYLLRDGQLHRLTQDHSLVEELIRRGQITPQEAEEHPQRSIITRALGPEPEIAVDSFRQELADDDIYLLCSDGLTTMLSDEKIYQLLKSGRSLKQIGNALVASANLAGGRDNISVVLLRVKEGEQREGSGRVMPKWLRKTAKLAAVLLILMIPVGVSGWFASRSVFFLGSDRGTIAIFRGLPYELPFGVKLYSSYYRSGVTVQQLTPKQRKRLLNHRMRSEKDASNLVDDLELGKIDD